MAEFTVVEGTDAEEDADVGMVGCCFVGHGGVVSFLEGWLNRSIVASSFNRSIEVHFSQKVKSKIKRFRTDFKHGIFWGSVYPLS